MDGSLFYYTVIEGPDKGLFVKPDAYYGTVSFIRGNYSYVLFEYVDAPYQLKGGEDSNERKIIKSAEARQESINTFLNMIKFNQSGLIKFPLKE